MIISVVIKYIGKKHWGFPDGIVIKNPPANAGDIRDTSLIPQLGWSPGVGNGNPLQYSCLENSMDRGAWWATVHRVTRSWTPLKWLSMQACTPWEWAFPGTFIQSCSFLCNDLSSHCYNGNPVSVSSSPFRNRKPPLAQTCCIKWQDDLTKHCLSPNLFWVEHVLRTQW